MLSQETTAPMLDAKWRALVDHLHEAAIAFVCPTIRPAAATKDGVARILIFADICPAGSLEPAEHRPAA